MIPSLLLLFPLTLAACAPQEQATFSIQGDGLAVAAWIPNLFPDHGAVLREDLPPPPGVESADFGMAGHDDLPLPPSPIPSLGDAGRNSENARLEAVASWTLIAQILGVPERRTASRSAREEIGADCAGHLPQVILPFATPWIDIPDGRIAVAADGEGAPMLYLQYPDGDWHCGLIRAEAPARPGRWQIHVGALLEGTPVPPVRLRIAHAAP
jgi:hypothetical protein